ncbi:SOS response-associated peptidase [Aestuariibacter halophilus]|uniref:Abasic site processing protein n=1 Tax=Fluctibacter halophilus TaxID=226011 RepID=A0ABS8GD11_9ALTE|nr:SOS response-associated peptidase [Aestuariibacter halophilus]MCC2617679.1 SOS response-associated peptidase [Aestuariibacter halophilus]
MCGRFANHVGAMHGWDAVLGDWPGSGQLSFNVAPTQPVPVVLRGGTAVMRWGMIPPWSDTPNPSFSTFNARLDSVAQKPTFRHAWALGQRCLVPILGYYEWRQQNGRKQPYFVTREDKGPTVLAGLFETAHREGFPPSFTVLTRPAQGQLATLHHAMPVMISAESGQAWLQDDVEMAWQIAHKDTPQGMYFYPVSPSVNNVRWDNPDAVKPLSDTEKADDAAQQGFDF